MIKVLLVEDDPMVSKIQQQYLSQLKEFSIENTAKNGKEALLYLDNANYDLVLLDIFMPEIDGLELLVQIRNRNYPLDVIIISAANDRKKIQKAIRYGAFDYIIKPFEFERFALALNNYKEYRDNFSNIEVFKQSDLDKKMRRAENIAETINFKGIDKNTLRDVWKFALSFENTFNSEEIAILVGISRVSIRKYLEFLKSINLLSSELSRASIGRPVYKYKCLEKSFESINNYTS